MLPGAAQRERPRPQRRGSGRACRGNPSPDARLPAAGDAQLAARAAAQLCKGAHLAHQVSALPQPAAGGRPRLLRPRRAQGVHCSDAQPRLPASFRSRASSLSLPLALSSTRSLLHSLSPLALRRPPPLHQVPRGALFVSKRTTDSKHPFIRWASDFLEANGAPVFPLEPKVRQPAHAISASPPTDRLCPVTSPVFPPSRPRPTRSSSLRSPRPNSRMPASRFCSRPPRAPPTTLTRCMLSCATA